MCVKLYIYIYIYRGVIKSVMHYISKQPFMKTKEELPSAFHHRKLTTNLHLYFESYEASHFIALAARKFSQIW